MRTTSFYPGGPEGGPSDLTPAAEVHEARRILGRIVRARHVPTGEYDPDAFIQARELRVTIRFDAAALAEIEQYDSAAELAAARDRELWGDDPFGEG